MTPIIPIPCPVCGTVPTITDLHTDIQIFDSDTLGNPPYVDIWVECCNEGEGCFVRSPRDTLELGASFDEMWENAVLSWNTLKRHFNKRILFIDTETTGRAAKGADPVTSPDRWPRMVEIGWIYTDNQGFILKSDTCIVEPNGFSIPDEATAIHGITTEEAVKSGIPLKRILAEITPYLWAADLIVGHNLFFDMGVIRAEQVRMGMPITPMNAPTLCTLEASTEFCGIPGLYGGFKWPKLSELHSCLFGETEETAHRALDDVTVTKNCFFEMVKRGIVSCP